VSTFILTNALSATPKGFTGVRFSLHPKVKGAESIKVLIKNSVSGLSDLGVEVRTDDVSTVILGPEPTLFEAIRVAFGSACSAEGEPQVSMTCTFSAGCPGEPDNSPMPTRTASDDVNEWIDDAYNLPSRVACQFAVYPLGSSDYMSTIREVISEAKRRPVFKDGVKTHFCTMLDGDGGEVFDLLRSSFALARKRNGGHVTMTATMTANKNAWK